VTKLWAAQAWFDSQFVQGFLFLTAITFRPSQMPIQPSMKWVLRALSMGYEADQSSPSSVRVKNTWSYTSTHP